MNHFFCNPFFLYFASWSIVCGLYLLRWSDLYPIISGKLLLFLTVTCIISLLLALYTHKKRWFVYYSVKDPQRILNMSIKMHMHWYIHLTAKDLDILR